MPSLDLSAERIKAITDALMYYAEHSPESVSQLSAERFLSEIASHKDTLRGNDLMLLGTALYFYRDSLDQEFDELEESEKTSFLANRKVVNSILRDIRHAFSS